MLVSSHLGADEGAEAAAPRSLPAQLGFEMAETESLKLRTPPAAATPF